MGWRGLTGTIVAAVALACVVLLGGGTQRAVAAPAAACALHGSGSEGPIDASLYHVHHARINASMIFVDFPDHPMSGTPQNEPFVTRMVSFAKRWYDENSYGRTHLQVTYGTKWLRMDKDASAYGFADGVSFDEQRAYIAEAVKHAEDAGFDFGGRQTVYVVAAPTGGVFSQSPAFIAADGDAVVTADGTRIRWGATTGDDVRDTDFDFGAHVLAHETGHTLGLPDLYYYGKPYPALHDAVGGWDLMGNIAPGLDTLAWHKLTLGWLADDQWRCVGDQTVQATLTPSSVNDGGLKMLATATSPSVAYAAEVRAPVPGTLDANMCDSGGGGVLFYRIDANVASGEGPIQLSSDLPGTSPKCGPKANAPYDPGDSVTAGGVTMTVLSRKGNDYRVRLSSPGRPSAAAKAVLVTRTTRLRHRRRIRIKVRCSHAVPACTGRVTLRTRPKLGRRRRTLGVRRFPARAGRTRRIDIRVGARNARRLARYARHHRRIKVTARVRSRNPQGRTSATKATFRLKLPGRRHRR